MKLTIFIPLFITGPNIVNLQLYFATFVRVFFDCVADVEGAFRLNIASLWTLAKGYAIHYIVALIVNQFKLNVLLTASYDLARPVVVDALGTEYRF